MGEDRKLSPGQWAPWISDPDPLEPSMTEEEMTAAAKAAKAYMAAHPAPAPRSSNPPEQTAAERKAEMMALILRNHPELTPEDVQGLLDSFF